MSHGIYVPPDSHPKPLGWTVSLDNPWSVVTFRWYQAKKKYSEPLIDMNRREIIEAERSLESLRSANRKARLSGQPVYKDDMALRERSIIDRIKRNQAVIDRHYASLDAMKRELIRYGFINERL